MTQPQFRPPRHGRARRHGRGHVYTEAEATGRLRHLESINRRCDGAGRTCLTNTATREMTLAKYDDNGVETERIVVRACARHRKTWVRYEGWTELGFKMLGDAPDPDTGLYVSGCYVT